MRLVLLAAGLVVAASLLVLMVAFAFVWGLRHVFARLTGRPVSPFVIRIDPRAGFGRTQRKAADPAPAHRGRRVAAGVTDVEAKPPRSDG